MYDYEQVTASAYLSRRRPREGSFGGFFTPENVRALTNSDARCFLERRRRSGFIVDGDELRGLFANPDAGAGEGTHALGAAVAYGARRLNCFSGFLSAWYAARGWKVEKYLPFVDSLAPPNWNYERDGRPDVVYMRYPADAQPR